MKIAITGATGFVGRELVRQLVAEGHQLRCWKRETSRLEPFVDLADSIEWVDGELGDADSTQSLVTGCQRVVHAGLWRAGESFRGGEGDIVKFARLNLVGSIELIESAMQAGVEKFVFVSTGAVHEKILTDRPLDEAHPLWPLTHYGAYKAALEKFVHSYGFGTGFPICAVRPTGIYGIADPPSSSKWFDIVERVIAGKNIIAEGGSKVVHVADVARAISLLLDADDVAGESYACYDRYISEHDVASIAVRLTGSQSKISGSKTTPKHEIVTDKLEKLGMKFGGAELLERTVADLISAIESGA